MTAKKEPSKGGRPSSYKPEYANQALKLARLGATDKEMADFFGVAESTLNKWKIDFKELSESLKEGKLLSDAEVADKLFNRALGYSHAAVKIITVGGVVEKVRYIEHYPPDTTACIFWLKNRQPHLWRDKREEGEADKTNAADLLRSIADELPD